MNGGRGERRKKREKKKGKGEGNPFMKGKHDKQRVE